MPLCADVAVNGDIVRDAKRGGVTPKDAGGSNGMHEGGESVVWKALGALLCRSERAVGLLHAVMSSNGQCNCWAADACGAWALLRVL